MDFQDNDGKAVRYQIEQLLTAIDEGAAATEEDGANG